MQVAANVNESILFFVGASISEVSLSSVPFLFADYQVVRRNTAAAGFPSARIAVTTPKFLMSSRELEYALDPYRRGACIE